MSNEIVITVKNLSKSYRMYNTPAERLKELVHPFKKKYHKEFWALQDVSFEVKKGESIGIIGRNGSGKSTLLQVLCGVLQPTSGTVAVRGRVSALLELGAGFSPEFTGRDNVYMNGALMGISREEMDERFHNIAEFADIGDFIEQPVKTYSSGMYVRLAFACAVNVEPDILIVDEALAVGDAYFQAKCYEKIRGFQSNGGTVVFVTHDLSTVTHICTKAVLFDNGKVVQNGKPRDVVNLYSAMIAAQTGAEDENSKHVTVYPDNKPDKRSGARHGEQDFHDAGLRYGQGGAEVIYCDILDDSGASVAVLETGRPYRAIHRVKFHTDVEKPIFGVLFKTVTGIEICGDNTFFHDIPAPSVRAGDAVDVSFEFTATMNPGVFLV
ncbi:MAG: ABC transporter ATP-binding protein, partial [Deltaproteobacteria bacterium]|nr:ABC transporter ATP-binding protein [Deltaproteobacteria bacterium]